MWLIYTDSTTLTKYVPHSLINGKKDDLVTSPGPGSPTLDSSLNPSRSRLPVKKVNRGSESKGRHFVPIIMIYAV